MSSLPEKSTEANNAKTFHIQTMRWVRDLPEQHETTWEDLRDWLINVERTKHPKSVEEEVTDPKTGKVTKQIVASLPGWCPCKLRDTTLEKGRRAAANVESVSCLVLDYDDLTAEQWAQVKSNLEGLSHAYHSTYSFSPVSGELCYRVAVQLDQPVPAKQWKSFFLLMASELGASTNDPSCSDASRFYYAAYCPEDGPAPDSGFGEGDALPTAEILARLKSAPSAIASTRNLTHEDLRKVVTLERYEAAENDNTKEGYRGLLKALDGRPFAQRGQRHDTLLFMSGILARKFPKHTAEQIIAPIRSVLPDDDDKIPADVALIGMLERDLENNRARKLDQARAEGRAPYTPEQRDQILKLAGAENEQAFVRSLIIDCERAGLFVLAPVEAPSGEITALDYRPYKGKHEQSAIIQALERFCEAFPITLQEETVKGTKLKPVHLLLSQYGQHLVEHTLSFEVEQSHYDPNTRTFTEPAARVRSFGPHRDPHLRTFLEQSLGEEQLQALDHALYNWRQLRGPAPALLIEGETGRGKTNLYADGLAQPWSDAGCTGFASLFKFTGNLRKSPVVCADEEMPLPRSGSVLQQFKSLTGSSSQRIEGKGQDEKYARGCLRYVLTANDGERFVRTLLQEGSVADVAPLLRRVLLLELKPDAPDPGKVEIPITDQRTRPRAGKSLIDHVRDEHSFARYIEDLETRAQVAMAAGLPDLTEQWTRLAVGRDEQAVLDTIEAYLFDDQAPASFSDGPAVHVRSTDQLWVNVEALCAYAQAKQSGALKPSMTRSALKALGATEPGRCRLASGARPRYWPLSRKRLASDEHLDARLEARAKATTKLAASADQVPSSQALREQLTAMKRATNTGNTSASSAPGVVH